MPFSESKTAMDWSTKTLQLCNFFQKKMAASFPTAIFLN